jgi:NADPH-dependent 2,4-dienoyl-CoA reductase/sulfur reductase-like enzyme
MLECDLVLAGLGIDLAAGFVEGADRDADGGLRVTERMSVAPGVWAAGDVAWYRDPYGGRDVRIEHWRVAEQQGRAAARDMAGVGEPFTAVPFFWTQHFDLQLSYAGAGRGWDELVMTGDLDAGDFLALYASDGLLLAACGTRDRELGAFMELMRLGLLPSAGEVKEVADTDFAARLLKAATR